MNSVLRAGLKIRGQKFLANAGPFLLTFCVSLLEPFGEQLKAQETPTDAATIVDQNPVSGSPSEVSADPESANAHGQSEESAESEDSNDADADSEATDSAAVGSEGADGDGRLQLPLFGSSTFTMTSTTTGRFRGNNYDPNRFDDDFFSLQQRFDLALQGDELRAELRLDAFVPFTVFEESRCPVGFEASCYLNWDVRPERMTLRWEHESWLIEAGDTQLVLGRGIALSFRKVDLLGVDNALRGGHIRFDDGSVRARLHIGMANPQNQDPVTLGILDEPEDMIAVAGLGATIGPDDLLSVGVHGGRIWFEDDVNVPDVRRAIETVGWTLEMPNLVGGELSLYAEANALRRTFANTFGDQRSFGHALYASAQVQSGNVTLLLEWKDYRNFLIAPSSNEASAQRIYSAAPNIEFVGPQRLRGIGNQRGGALRFDYAFLPGPWSFSLNQAVFTLAEDAMVDPFEGVFVSHSWATLVRRQEYDNINWGFELSGGYRQENFLRNPGVTGTSAWDIDRQMTHFQAETTLGSGDHSFDINVDHRFETERLGNTAREFEIGGASLTYSLGVQLALTLGLRWTDQRQGITDQREALDYNFLGGLMYPSLEARWNFDPGTFVKVFLGSTPGGLICSGGVCREVPAYEGVLLQFVGRV